MSDIDYVHCDLGPFLPAVPVRLGRARLALEIAENDNGELEMTERDPKTWEVVDDEAA